MNRGSRMIQPGKTTLAILMIVGPGLLWADPACLINTSSASFDVCSQTLKVNIEAPDSFGEVHTRAASPLRVIKYSGPVTAASRQALADANIDILQYLPWYGYVVRIDTELPNDPAIVWQGPIPPILKISPELFSLQPAFAEAEIPIRVEFWDGESISMTQNAWQASDQVRVVFQSDLPRTLELGLQVKQAGLNAWLESAASLDEVRSIRLMRPAQLLNSEAGWLHQSGDAPGNLPVFAQGIFGCGQTIGVLDSGFDYGSCAFRDDTQPTPTIESCSNGANCPVLPMDDTHRKIGIYYNWSGSSAGDDPCGMGSSVGHGTHVAGSISGNQIDHPADCDQLQTPGMLTDFDGTAPGARLITQQAGNSLQYLNNLGGNIYHAARTAFESGARIHNNSWGSGCCIFGILCTCDQPLAYNGNAELADEVTFEFPELFLAIAAGNDGPCCGGGNIGNPAIAKNALTVGATNRGADANARASFSSQGPTRDRRIKPDVMAQGNNIVSAGSTGNPDTDSCEDCVLSGTSMATPTAAGLAGLVRDYLAQGFYPSGMPDPDDALDNPHAALIRAMLINSSVTMDGNGTGPTPPNQQQGWGRITLDQVLFFDGDQRELWLNENRLGLQTGDVDEQVINVSAGEPLKITLVWHDYPGAPNSEPSIVNLLRLEVESPDGQIWTQKLPPSGDPNPLWDTSEVDYDDRNTVHQWTVEDPADGEYIVRVRAINVAMGNDPIEPVQPYALVVTGSGVGMRLDSLLFADGFEVVDVIPSR